MKIDRRYRNGPGFRFFAVCTLLILAAAAGFMWLHKPDFHDGCLNSQSRYAICAASSMARFTREQKIYPEHPDLDISGRTIKLVAARNETIAFQLVVRTLSADAPDAILVKPGNWLDKAGNSLADIRTSLFKAHYHWIENGGYQWGPDSDVLDWPAYYPDALVPQHTQCAGQSHDLFGAVTLPAEPGQNQAIWFDTYIPVDLPAGDYTGNLLLQTQSENINVNLQLEVVDAVLPHKPSISAVGEVYRAYRVEGAGEQRDTGKWQDMSFCYQHLAHQHRLVFIERTPMVPEEQAWSRYINTVDPILSGELFTGRYGYVGTGEGTPPTVWRTPWPQEFDVKLEQPLSEEDLLRYSGYARLWAEAAAENGWNQTRFFAYVFDEIDGPSYDKVSHRDYLAMVHLQMALLQNALDQGSPDNPIDLLWTSHSNPAQWADDPELDLRNKIRLWSPNASAADPEFLGRQIAAGDHAWFYHSGHPAIGTHSINSSGIELRTWGLVAARYGFQGNFMWAVNLGSDSQPFAEPSYKPEDDRFGNGVMVYPGNQLDKIGYHKYPGPVPSMRLKAWRRGLQDAELYYLAKKNHPAEADSLLRQLIPSALAATTGSASWPREPAAWIEFRKRLLTLASGISTR